MGIEHRGVVTGRGRFTLRRRPRGRTRFTWDGTAHVPLVDGRRGRRGRGQAGAARGVAPQPAPARQLVQQSSNDPPVARLSVRRMTKYAMSVAGIQTLGTDMTLDVVARSRRARLRLGLGRRGERGRGDVDARRDQPGRAAPRRSAPACSRCNSAPRRCTRWRRRPCSNSSATATCTSASASRRRRSRVSGTARATPTGRSRRCASSSRSCASASRVRRSRFEGDFYTVKRFRLGVRLGEHRPKIFVAALNEQMLRLAGGDRRRRVAQLPPRVASAVVRRAGPRRRRRRGVRVRALRRHRPRSLRRPRPQGPLELRGGRRRTRTSSRRRDSPTTSPSSAPAGTPANATPRSPRSATPGSTTSRSWATPRTCAPRSRPTSRPAPARSCSRCRGARTAGPPSARRCRPWPRSRARDHRSELGARSPRRSVGYLYSLGLEPVQTGLATTATAPLDPAGGVGSAHAALRRAAARS